MIRSTGRQRLLSAVALASGLTLLAAGCSSSSNDEGNDGDAPSTAEARTLNVWAGSQTPIVENFNPYAPGVLHAALGGVYETFFVYNKVQDDPPIPMLAESAEFNDDGTELTVVLRQGVQWSDGEDFDAEDVIYSFTAEHVKRDWVKSVEAVDPHTVTFTFDGPQFTSEFALLGASWLVPEHIWSGIENPIEIVNENPVGTGPYIVDTVSDNAYTVTANPGYWGGEPAVSEIRYLGVDQNQTASDLLTSGQIDWATMFIPDVDAVLADGRLGYLNTPQDPTVLYTCANVDLGCEGPQTDKAVRQALNLAIDRGEINEKAFVGLAADISPTFALLGRDDHWISPDVESVSPQTADVDGAKAILEDAGYELGADGIFEKDGQKLELELTSVDGWTDYNDAARLIEESARAAGIGLTASTVTWQEFSDSRQSGEFELVMGGVVGTSVADPFQIYRDWFSGEYTQPVGEILQPGEWNFSRYDNPAVNDAVKAAAATNDEAAKQAAYATIQEHIVEDLPYIPIVINATQTFFDTSDFTGWPTEDDTFVFPPAWSNPSSGVILGKLAGQ
ncbi:ABC transporter substrate-binding protein [Oerskovia flava]|uniref:ABC transporter substrate-binding protein n=1 Tax=Oerskovia flava TaxID=2986422 RepID=UPI002240BB53|nr:ABC transporter substrate-binding protein [Oerskovia sp. JB1-3-2]